MSENLPDQAPQILCPIRKKGREGGSTGKKGKLKVISWNGRKRALEISRKVLESEAWGFGAFGKVVKWEIDPTNIQIWLPTIMVKE